MFEYYVYDGEELHAGFFTYEEAKRYIDLCLEKRYGKFTELVVLPCNRYSVRKIVELKVEEVK